MFIKQLSFSNHVFLGFLIRGRKNQYIAVRLLEPKITITALKGENITPQNLHDWGSESVISLRTTSIKGFVRLQAHFPRFSV